MAKINHENTFILIPDSEMRLEKRRVVFSASEGPAITADSLVVRVDSKSRESDTDLGLMGATRRALVELAHTGKLTLPVIISYPLFCITLKPDLNEECQTVYNATKNYRV